MFIAVENFRAEKNPQAQNPNVFLRLLVEHFFWKYSRSEFFFSRDVNREIFLDGDPDPDFTGIIIYNK